MRLNSLGGVGWGGRGAVWLAVAALLAGCQTDSPIDELLQGRKIEYEREDSQNQRSLQYPPDLLSTATGVEGTVSLSEYTIGSVPDLSEDDVTVAVDAPSAKVAYRRRGNLRWVEVGLPPKEVWGRARAFWNAYLGFGLEKENAELGVMETGWLDLRERLSAPGWFSEYIDTFLNRASDSGQRDRFVTRLELNDSGGTDVFLAHRYAIARFGSEGQFTGFETQVSDRELEIEMMRRLMLYFAGRNLGDEEAVAIDEQVAEAEAAGESDYRLDGDELFIDKPFHESWQLVQVGLDRGGFSIEDRDYQEGVIYIRHSGGPESDKIFGKAETRFFNKLFGEEKPILRDIRLVFEARAGGEGVRLTAEAVPEDDELTELQAAVVLELLHQYLP